MSKKIRIDIWPNGCTWQIESKIYRWIFKRLFEFTVWDNHEWHAVVIREADEL